MVNRKGFTVVQLLVAAFVVGLLLIILVAVPNIMRQTRNSSRAQDIHVLGLLIKDEQSVSSTGALPASCNNTQISCFAHTASLSFYDNNSDVDTNITYYRNTKPFNVDSAHLRPSDDDIAHKVIIQTYAVCNDDQLSGETAGAASIAIQYAVETMRGVKIVCKSI